MTITIEIKNNHYIVNGLQSHGMVFTGAELLDLSSRCVDAVFHKKAIDALDRTILTNPNPMPRKWRFWRRVRS